MTSSVAGSGTAGDPWILATPPGKSEFEAWRDEDAAVLDMLALGAEVEVVQPLRLRARVLETAQRITELHSPGGPD